MHKGFYLSGQANQAKIMDHPSIFSYFSGSKLQGSVPGAHLHRTCPKQLTQKPPRGLSKDLPLCCQLLQDAEAFPNHPRAIISSSYPQFALGEVFRTCPTRKEQTKDMVKRHNHHPKDMVKRLCLSTKDMMERKNFGHILGLFWGSLSLGVGHARNTSPRAN